MTPIEAMKKAIEWSVKSEHCCIDADRCVLQDAPCFFIDVIGDKRECTIYEVFSTIKKAILENKNEPD